MARIVVDLVANTGSFAPDIQRAAKDAERSLKQFEQSAVVAGQAFGVAAAAAATAITVLSKQQIDLADSVGKLSQRLGVTTEFLSAMEYAAKRNGSSIATMDGALSALVGSMKKAEEGSKSQADAFRELGVSIFSSRGGLKTVEELLPEIAKGMQNIHDPTERAALAQKLLGDRSNELMQTLQELADKGLSGVEDKARSMGQLLGQEATQAAADFKDKLDEVNDAIRGATNVLLGDMLPAINGLLQQTATGEGLFSDLKIAAEGLATGLRYLAVAFDAVKNLIEQLTAIGAGLVDTLITLGGAAVDSAKNFYDLGNALKVGAEAGSKLGSIWSTVGDIVNQQSEEAYRFQKAMLDTSTSIDVAGKALGGLKSAWGKLSEAIAPHIKRMETLVVTYDEGAKGAKRHQKSAEELYAALIKLSKGAQLYADAVEAAYRATHSLERDNTSLIDHMAEQNDRLNGLSDSQIAYNRELRDQARAMEEILALGPPTEEAQNAILQHQKLLADSHLMDEAAENQRKYRSEVEETGRVWESFTGDLSRAIAGGTKSVKQYWHNMIQDLKAQLIQSGLMAIIRGLFGGGGGSIQIAGGGGGGSAIGAIASMFLGGGGGGGGYGGSGIGQVSGIAQMLSGTGGSGGFSLFSPSSWVSAGKSLWSGFSGNGGAFSFFNRGFESAPDFVGPPTSMQGTGGYSNGFGQALGVAGGVYAGYQRYKNTEGGAAGIAGAAAYGVGTYFAGAAVSAAMAGGISAGLAAIPVVGWIALAAMLIDHFSGGKLFGTKFATKAATQALNITAAGGDATTVLHQERQGALFSGKKKRDKTVESSPEAEKAAQDLFKSIGDTMKQAANALQIEVPPVINASFETLTEFDKKGHAKSTKFLVKAFGQQWEEATAEAAQQRLGTEALLAVVDKASGGVAMALAAKWQSNVEMLADGVQFLMAAQASLTHKTEILGTNLTEVTSVVEEFAVSGESLTATYQRLTQETKSVQDAFALAGQTLSKTGHDLIEFADDIAQKAGGGDAAQQLWSRFFSSFYTEAELAQRQAQQLQPKLMADLSAVGLGGDTSLASFRAAFEQQLPTLTAEQVVQWLRLADELATMNELLAKTGGALSGVNGPLRDYAAMVADLDQQLAEAGKGGGISAFQKALAEIGQQQITTIAQMNAAARAAGLQGAREQDLAKVHELAAMRAAAAVRQLDAASLDIIARLRGDNGITGAAQSAVSALGSVSDGIGGVADAAQKFRDSMLLDSQLSPLNTQQQLDEAMRQLQKTGDEGTARRALELARSLTASGADYRRLFDQITALVRAPADTSGSMGGYDASASTAVQLSAAERAQLAQQLAQNVADKAGFSGDTFAEVASQWGYSLDQLGRDLGITGDELNQYLESLQASSYGLDDIANVYNAGVDRIVNAILNGEDITGAVGASSITGSKGLPETSTSIPQVSVAAEDGSELASNDELRTTNIKLDALLTKIDKVIEVGIANVKATASGTDELTEVLDGVRGSVDDVRREIGSSSNGDNFRTKTWTQPR